MWGAHEGMGWWMIFGAAWIVLFWVAILALVAWVVDRAGERGEGRQDSALEILKRRYARGELSPDEYARMRKDLE